MNTPIGGSTHTSSLATLFGGLSVVGLPKRCRAPGCTSCGPGKPHYCDRCCTYDADHRARNCPNPLQQQPQKLCRAPGCTSCTLGQKHYCRTCRTHDATHRARNCPTLKSGKTVANVTTTPILTPVNNGTTRCGKCHKCRGNQGGGAGVVMVDQTNGQIILVEDHLGTYADAGGKCDSTHRCYLEVAAQEFYQEGRMQVDLRRGWGTLSKSRYTDINRAPYRTYFLPVNGNGQPVVSCSKFYGTSVSHLPSPFQETTRMTRFPIAGIKASWVASGKGYIVPEWQVDDKNVKRKLGGRIRKSLAKAFAQGIL